MDWDDGIELLIFALEKEEEQLIFSRWIQGAHNIMSFEAYKAALQERSKPPRADEEILDDVGNILASFEAER